MTESCCTLEELKKRSRWLNRSASNVYSQAGEDGIIAKALTMLPATNRWCVEFGAWNGKYLSNTYNLVENSQYNAVLIEGDQRRYQSLCREYPFKDRAIFVGQFVGWTEHENLDTILGRHPIPLDFDLLSIDVDGNDYHIWEAVKKYRPKCVLIEFNPTSSNRMDYVQPADPRCTRGCSPAALVRLGKEKGYEVICVTELNLLFVDRQYFEIFAIPDNSLAVMRDEDKVISTYIGYDGYILSDNPFHLPWHGIGFKMKQPLPQVLRTYPDNYNPFQRFLYRVRRRLS